MERKIHKSRLIAVFLFFLTLQVILLLRLVYIQATKSISFSKIADSQHKVFIDLEPRRGTIYDRNMYKLAFNINVDSVFAIPREMSPGEKPVVARKLAATLGLNEDFAMNRLRRKKGFVWIKRKISQDESDALRAQRLKNVEFIKESKRLYPNGYLAAHLIGFAGLDNAGLEGLELRCDRYLRGKPGFRLTYRDAKRRPISSKDEKFMAPVNGFNLILNIDETIQAIADKALDDAYKKYRAKGAIIIVMDPRTGEILALADRPTYDPNVPGLSDMDSRRNRAVADTFEPGSVFKIITASAALEKQVVTLDDKIFCENGKWWVAGHVLHDHTPHGTITFREVIEKSSNIGIVKVAQRLAPHDLYGYVRDFGFGQLTGVDLDGEVGGKVYPPEQWSKTSITALPMGQEVTVTAMQLVRAISVIANGGLLVRPWVLKEVRDDKGETIAEFSPKIIKRVISEETAQKMRGVLKGAVEKGTGTMGKLESYTAGGKTGTAQKVEPTGVYSHSRFVGSFIGFAPADNPRLAIAVCIDEPRPVYYGGVVAAPVFKKVAEDALRYMGVAPDVKNKEPIKVVVDVYND